MKKVISTFVLLFVLVAFVSAQTPQFYNYNNGTVNNSFPLNQAAGKMVQLILPPGNFSQPTPATAGNITKLYFLIATLYPLTSTTYTNFKIMLRQSTDSLLTAGSFMGGVWDTVYSQASVTLSATGGSWLSFTLSHPFAYVPTQSLVIQMEQCSAVGATTNYSLTFSTLAGNRRNYSVGGCPFVYSGVAANIVNCGFDISTAPPPTVINGSIVLPTPGVNTNYVSIPYNAGMTGWGNAITIEAWVKPGGTTTANTILNKGAASFDYQLGCSASTMLPFFRAGTTIVTSTVPLVAGVWQHIAVASTGTTVTFYLNGVGSAPISTATTLGSSTNEMRIGRGNADAGSGKLDEIRLWSVARSASEIAANMCNKWIPNNTTGLKAKWHFDSTLVDSVSGWNGSIMGNVGYDTAANCLITSIPFKEAQVIREYRLSQNYPNPFNPVTKISYDIPKSGFVSIKIYDIAGKEVATLVSGNMNAGRYIVDFDGTSLSSGIYFYRLESNGFVATKKMMLIK